MCYVCKPSAYQYNYVCKPSAYQYNYLCSKQSKCIKVYNNLNK